MHMIENIINNVPKLYQALHIIAITINNNLCYTVEITNPKE